VTDDVEKVRAFSSEYAVQRTWNITPSAVPTSGATIVFEYNDNDPAQVGIHFDKTKAVQVWSNHNGTWQPVSPPQMPTATSSGRKAVTLANCTQFSPFVIVNVAAPLPVHFSDFTTRVQAGGVQLQFTNAAENEVDHYIIERSADGQLFQTLMQLAPQYNNGSPATYRWLDAAPLAGEAWYRVKGVDMDGSISLTQARKVNWDRTDKTLTVYPNPLRGRTLTWQAVALSQGIYDVQVRNSTGQTVLRQQYDYNGDGIQTLTLPAALPHGIYYLHVSNGIIKQQQSFVVLE
jgi:hypothetical protein